MRPSKILIRLRSESSLGAFLDSQEYKLSSCEQRRLRSDCTNAQPDLCLRWGHILEGAFPHIAAHLYFSLPAYSQGSFSCFILRFVFWKTPRNILCPPIKVPRFAHVQTPDRSSYISWSEYIRICNSMYVRLCVIRISFHLCFIHVLHIITRFLVHKWNKFAIAVPLGF